MSVDRSQLEALIRDLGQVPPAFRKAARPAMLAAGRGVLEQMKANAGWSSRIPAAISMTPAASTFGVRFRTDAARAPHARPYEGLSGDPFRAPLWGDREHWYPHAARPFFYRAVDEHANDVVEALGEALDQAAAETGF
jgi:hypothetical protein